jgi:hypothetical protein
MGPFDTSDFSYHKNEKTVHVVIYNRSIRDMLLEETGQRYVTIHLEHDSPLLSMLFMKFNGREG